MFIRMAWDTRWNGIMTSIQKKKRDRRITNSAQVQKLEESVLNG